MIPISDHKKTRSTPLVTYIILALNIFAFLLMLSMGSAGITDFVGEYALIPSEVMQGRNVHTLVSSMFLHAGFGHIIGNMLFLNVFGDNLEEAMGHLGYLVFYLICGLGAAFLQIAVNPISEIPMLGASGAIAGLLGGYLVLFPKHKIDVLIPFGFIIRKTTVPASLMLIYWMFFQLLQGIGSLGIGGGGVAFFAHIGGFITGAAITYLFRPAIEKPQRGEVVRT